jgi:hypothetical protein
MKRLPLFFVIFVLCSCATQRINQFSSFAAAGVSYTNAMDKLTREAGQLAIDADNELLLKDRDLFSQEERGDIYIERTKALESLLSTISSIRVHTSLLSRYFSALNQLAGSQSPVTIPGQLTAIVTSLESIHPGLENAGFGGTSVKDFIKSASPLIISTFKQNKLEEELRKNGATIERELELQSALLQALSEQMKSDLELILKLKDFQSVTQPFISAPRLPENWKDKRKEILTTYLSLDAAERAKNAADELKNAYLNLLGSASGVADLKPLFDDINAMIDLVELVRKNSDR